MNATIDGTEPPYTTTTGDSGKPHGGDAYIFVVGFFCVVVLLISLTYTSYLCKRSPPPPPPPPFAFTTAPRYDEDSDSHRLIRFSRGLDDDVIVTFPTSLYSDAATATESCCSICLADYKQADVVRLLPACGHWYHVSCIDTWLKAHPTCPMCRNKPLPVPEGGAGDRQNL
ncbi:hypothetical protein SSX86_018551 [Deinandra increscens subsp. villosa]|uniref:RING-type domain-containing protein n=1 Tax=Deinandra increscens subsp. villosa TaxID=3103831 RepID=A0AAP0CVR3_9ASTR